MGMNRKVPTIEKPLGNFTRLVDNNFNLLANFEKRPHPIGCSYPQNSKMKLS